MPNVTVIIDGREHFSREVDTMECEECVDGTFTLSATFPPIEPELPPWTVRAERDGIFHA